MSLSPRLRRPASRLRRSARWTEADVPPQDGRVAVVTGSNTGLGFQVARVLAGRGATVVLACRDMAKAEAAADRILTASPQAHVTAAHLDLASLASVRAAANALNDAYERIDLLINNAGIMMTPYGQTEDGFEQQLGVNHLGPFALTGLLLNRMLTVDGSRVVTVTSFLHRRGRIDFGNLSLAHGYRRSPAYGRSKLANLLFTYELQRRLARRTRPRSRWRPIPGTRAPNCRGTCRGPRGWARCSSSRCSGRAPRWAPCRCCARPPIRRRAAVSTTARPALPA